MENIENPKKEIFQESENKKAKTPHLPCLMYKFTLVWIITTSIILLNKLGT